MRWQKHNVAAPDAQPRSRVSVAIEVRSFVEKRLVSFWESVQGDEYGFWANVNPEVPHPRWSQATERVLGIDGRRPTLKWNGYGEFVAHLYDGLEKERLFA